ncbi:MAG: TadE/TadG family type IV pilus assembly protein, partial [Parvularculaceae bacterium]
MKKKRKISATKGAGLLGDRRGSSAVEFAIVVPVFLALMFSMFEVGWFYFVNSVVDAAAINVARYIRTGQAQNAG